MSETEKALSLPLIDSSRADSKSDPNRQAFHLQSAKQIYGCYRRDDAADPDTYIAAVAAILSEYPDEVVEYVADPRTGLAKRSPFLPNTHDVAKDCDAVAAKLAVDRANVDFQKRRAATPRYIPVVIWEPNLFVSVEINGYDKMVARSKTEKPERYRHERGYLCADKVRRDGIWIPSSWWEERSGARRGPMTFLADISSRVIQREYGNVPPAYADAEKTILLSPEAAGHREVDAE